MNDLTPNSSLARLALTVGLLGLSLASCSPEKKVEKMQVPVGPITMGAWHAIPESADASGDEMPLDVSELRLDNDLLVSAGAHGVGPDDLEERLGVTLISYFNEVTDDGLQFGYVSEHEDGSRVAVTLWGQIRDEDSALMDIVVGVDVSALEGPARQSIWSATFEPTWDQERR